MTNTSYLQPQVGTVITEDNVDEMLSKYQLFFAYVALFEFNAIQLVSDARQGYLSVDHFVKKKNTYLGRWLARVKSLQ